jgi:hypothetical protein
MIAVQPGQQFSWRYLWVSNSAARTRPCALSSGRSPALAFDCGTPSVERFLTAAAVAASRMTSIS